MCGYTARRSGIFSSPAPFWHFGDSLCAAVDEELRLISDSCQHLSSTTAGMYEEDLHSGLIKSF